ncbi:MAG: site-specific integrase [Bacteroidetes bacterium]|nr:site-specific integrase [Bacteroidota bacterium]
MSRRPNHSGSVTQLSNGRFVARLMVDGRRVSAYARTKQEANAKLETLQRQAMLNCGLPEPGHTLGALLDHWLEVGQARWKPSTLAEYQRITRLIREQLGDPPLSRITPARLASLYAKFRDKPRNALYVHQALHCALGLAVRYGWLAASPADKVQRPGYRKKERPLWTVEQCKRFIDRTVDSPYWPMWTLALTTGLRSGELSALLWSDVDGHNHTLKVERTQRRIGAEWVVNAPKTASGRRTVHLGPLASQAIQRQRALQAAWRLQAGPSWNDTGRIFTNRIGGPIEPATIRQGLVKWCHVLGLPVINFHSLRHLAASLALQAGAPVALVSRNLGHSSVAITTAVYSHAIADGRLVAEALERALG